MPAVDTLFAEKVLPELKEIFLDLIKIRDVTVDLSKQQINIEVGGSGIRTLVDLNGNQIKLAEATKQTAAAFDSFEVKLGQVEAMKAKYNGSTDTMVGLTKKVASAEKELEAAALSRAKTETEASKARLNDAKAELQASQTLLVERKRQILEQQAAEKQASEARIAQAKVEADALKAMPSAAIAAGRAKEGPNAGDTAAVTSGSVVTAEETAALQAQQAAQRQMTAAEREAIPVKQQLVSLTEAEIEAELLQETTLKSLQLQLKTLRNEYMELNAVQRSSAEGTALLEQIQKTDGAVKDLQKSMGNATGNVGNYTSVWDKFGNIVQRMGLRMVASLIIFQAAIELVQALGEEFTRASERINYQQKVMSDIAVKSAGNFAQEAVELKAMKERFEDVATSMAGKKEIVDELNEKFGNQIGKINGINDAEKFFRDKTPDMIKALELRAKAAGALAVAQAAAQRQIEVNADPSKAQNTWDKILSVGKGALLGTVGGVAASVSSNATSLAGDLQDEVKAQQDILDYALKQYDIIENEATAFDQKTGVNTSRTAKKAKKGRAAKMDPDGARERLSALKEANQLEVSEEERSAKREADIFKKIADDDEYTLEERLTAYDAYQNARLKLVGLEGGKEIRDAEGRVKTLSDKEKQYNDGKLKLTKYQIDTLHIEQANAQKALKDLQQKGVDETNAILDQEAQDKRKIRESERAQDVQFEKDRLDTIKASYASEYEFFKKALDDKYAAGKLSKQQYDRDITELNNRIGGKVLDEQIDQLNEYIQTQQKEGKSVKELIDLYNQLVKARDGLKAGKPGNLLGWTDDEIKQFDSVKAQTQDYIGVLDNLNKIAQANTDKRVEGLQAEIAAIEKRKQTEIDAYQGSLQYSIDAEQKRAATIAAINAKAQEEEDARNEHVKQEKRKQAELDKALGIAKIIINTAIAVTAQLAIPGAGIGLAIAAGALGAAELAAAIATPIPQFAKGKEAGDSYEGPAIVGEKGAELVIPKSGSPWIADRETLAYLSKGDVVKTATDTQEILKHYSLMSMPMLREQHAKQYAMDDIMEGAADKIVRAIDRKRFPSQRADPAWWQSYYNRHTA